MTIEDKIREEIQKGDKYGYLLKSEEDVIVNTIVDLFKQVVNRAFIAGRSLSSYETFTKEEDL
jgi:hypothetical protein